MWYLNGALIFFIYGLIFFLKDKTTPKNHVMSWIVLIISSVTWPISAPLAIMELINRAKKKRVTNPPKVKIIQVEEITKTVNYN